MSLEPEGDVENPWASMMYSGWMVSGSGGRGAEPGASGPSPTNRLLSSGGGFRGGILLYFEVDHVDLGS